MHIDPTLFDQLMHLLQSNRKENLIVVRCIEEMRIDKYDIRLGINMSRKYIYDTYRNRFELQETVTHSKIKGYEVLLKNLKTMVESKIQTFEIETLNMFYHIFCSSDLLMLTGVLEIPKKDKIFKVLE